MDFINDIAFEEFHDIAFEKFQMKYIRKDAKILIIGKRGAGKSWLCRDILEQLAIPSGLIISPREKYVPFYENYFPESKILNQFDSASISELLQQQEDNDTNTFLLLDDCMTQKRDCVATNCRDGHHYRTVLILTLQQPLGIRPDIRAAFDYVFLFADNFVSNQRRLYEHYARTITSFDFFQTIFEALTEDYHCMVIDQRNNKIFWHCANLKSFAQ
jgi:GTPase SAR1 family protein